MKIINILLKNNYSKIIFIISQLADVQYFDGKISLITWILMAGLKNIILDNDYRIVAQ